MRIPLTAPLDLSASLDGGQVFRWAREGEWWWGVLGDTALRMRLVDGCLDFASAPTSEEATRPRLLSYLSLDEDPTPRHDALHQDGYLSAALDQFPGLRLLRQDPWECLVSFICSAECSIPRIRHMVDGLSHTLGAPIGLDSRSLWSFPSPEALARAGEERLRHLGLGFRAPSVLAAAQRVASGDMDLDRLRRMEYEEAHQDLLTLPGVGPKIADCVLLFSLGQGKAFPLDRWVRRAVARVYGLDNKTPDRAITAWARRHFGTHAGYAQQLLFHLERLQR